MIIKPKFQHIINIVSNVMESYTAALFVYDEKKEWLQLACFHSLSKNIKKGCCIKDGEGLIGWVFREKKNLLATNYERNTQTLLFYEEDEKIKSLMAVHLPEGMGVLFVDSKKGYSFTEEKEKICAQFGFFIYTMLLEEKHMERLSLENTYYSLVHNLRTKKDEGEFVEHYLEMVLETLELSHLFIVNPGKMTYRAFFTEYDEYRIEKNRDDFTFDSLLGWCIKNRKNVLKNDIKTKKTHIINREKYENIRNLACIPVWNQEKNETVAFGFVKKEERAEFGTHIYWQECEKDLLTQLCWEIYKVLFYKS